MLGIDVGCSPARRSSAACRIAWNAHEVTWRVARFRAVEPERTDTIVTMAGSLPLACAAFDGPLRRGFEAIGRYRTAERMLTRRLGRRIGKPGASSAPVGILLNAHANACARTVLQHCDMAPATHATPIDDRAVVEAFPSSFLGVMIDDPSMLAARRHNRSDLFFLHGCERGIFDRLIGHLLPGRGARIRSRLGDRPRRARRLRLRADGTLRGGERLHRRRRPRRLDHPAALCAPAAMGQGRPRGQCKGRSPRERQPRPATLFRSAGIM